MSLRNFYFVLGVGVLLTFGNCSIPDYIKVCHANEPNITSCILNSVNELRPRLKVGIPELDVPPVEPLHLDKITLKRGPANAQLASNISDILVWGPSEFVVRELKVDIPNSKFSFKVLLPELHFKGQYDIDMQILFVQFKGRGPIHGNFTNYSFNAVMKGNKIMRDGVEYLEFDRMKIRIFVGKANLHLENLFNGDPVLGRASNDLVNDNADLFLNEIRPSLEMALAEKFTDIANKITLRFSYKELFP